MAGKRMDRDSITELPALTPIRDSNARVGTPSSTPSTPSLPCPSLYPLLAPKATARTRTGVARKAPEGGFPSRGRGALSRGRDKGSRQTGRGKQCISVPTSTKLKLGISFHWQLPVARVAPETVTKRGHRRLPSMRQGGTSLRMSFLLPVPSTSRWSGLRCVQ